MSIKQIRILPPLAVARLGSSPEPLENYELEIPDAVAPRKIVPSVSLSIDAQGNPSAVVNKGAVSFRDSNGLIRPVAPFFEVWAQTDKSDEWVPLTMHLLADNNLAPDAVQWSAHIANIKVYRRTEAVDDQIHANAGPFSDHVKHDLLGLSANFLPNESIPFGSLQYVRPNPEHPEIRIRFTPAHGKVYGTWTGEPDPDVVKPVYDPKKSHWKGYREPDTQQNTFEDRKQTNPNEIFAGYSDNGFQYSYGYVDDECDGIIEASLTVGGRRLTSFARVAAGPPTFAPDGKPVRTVADELEQALFGPDAAASPEEIDDVREIVRCALETVRLLNTGQMNKPGTTRGVGMARMDILDYSRASEPIFDPVVADSLAIRARHERVLLGLESGSLVWFARILREFDKVGDLTDEGRRRMPGMMRNADGRHLALTRRQVSKIKAAADYIVRTGGRPAAPAAAKSGIRPVNLPAQLEYRGAWNPPNTATDSAISNAYPGLEMDFRNVWRRLLEGIVLHESANLVVDVEKEELKSLKGMLIVKVGECDVTAPVTGPNDKGQVGPLANSFGETRMALEWSNALALVLRKHAGQEVPCVFTPLKGGSETVHGLRVRSLFEADSPTISREIAEPGALTQSLCAPWQNDYRECACFYWAANRPDYVNVESRPDGSSAGNNWMQKDRTPQTAKVYINDDWQDDRLYTHTDLVRDWEKLLRFVIGNEDEAPIV